MRDFEQTMKDTDFSKYTDLKSRLAKRLFSGNTSKKVVSFPFASISDEDAAFVNAAQGIYQNDHLKKDKDR